MTKINFLPFLQVVTDITSKYNKIRNEDYLEEGLYPIIDQGQTFIGGYSNNTSLINHSSSPVIVFGDHTKTIKYIDFPFVIGADGVKVLKINEKSAVARYIYYFLKTINLPEAGYSRHFKYLKDIQLPVLESLSNQLHIANILSHGENLIAQRKESIRLLNEFLKSMFLEMFGESHKSEFPLFPLEKVTTKITDGEHGTVNRVDFGRLYLMARNISNENKIDFSEVSYISEVDHLKIFRRCNPEKGDLLLVCVGATIGKVALVPEMDDFSLARSVALIKPNQELLNSFYLLWFFNSPFGHRQVKNNSNEAAQAGLYTGNIKQIIIPIPPIELQDQFAQIVEKTETLKTQYQQSLKELESLYGSLSQRAFKGELTAKDGEMMMAAETGENYKTRL